MLPVLLEVDEISAAWIVYAVDIFFSSQHLFMQWMLPGKTFYYCVWTTACTESVFFWYTVYK